MDTLDTWTLGQKTLSLATHDTKKLVVENNTFHVKASAREI